MKLDKQLIDYGLAISENCYTCGVNIKDLSKDELIALLAIAMDSHLSEEIDSNQPVMCH